MTFAEVTDEDAAAHLARVRERIGLNGIPMPDSCDLCRRAEELGLLDGQVDNSTDNSELRAELARMDHIADRSWRIASALALRLERIYDLMGGCVLNEEGGDNVSATVPIDVWREMVDLCREPGRLTKEEMG